MDKFQEFELRQHTSTITQINTGIGSIKVDEIELIYELSKVIERYFKKHISEEKFPQIVIKTDKNSSKNNTVDKTKI